MSGEVALDRASGYFVRGGQRFIPVGVNYWPGSCGVEMWREWPEEEMRADLDLVTRLELNTLRFFLRWQDFEPELGHYNEAMFARLEQFLGWCRRRDLCAHPSVFVGWMSGAAFRPDWFAGRNLFSDLALVERAEAFCRKLSPIFARFSDCILAVDLGNELDCLEESKQAAPAAVRDWCGRVATALRSEYPQVILISGCDHNQVIQDTGWRLGDMPGMDLYSMHGYPVPAWHSLGFDGMTDPLAAELLAGYTGVARSFGPVLLQEFGTIVTFGKEQQEGYLQRLLPACWAAGANGFLWWCFRDIRARVRPYLSNGFEATLGLVDEQGRVKPGLQPFLDFGRGLQAQPVPVVNDLDTAVFISSQYYHRDNQDCPGHEPGMESGGILLARHFLQQLGRRVGFVQGNQQVPDGVKTLVVAGAHLRVDEAEVLIEWVREGGTLIWHGPDAFNWGPAYNDLTGAKPVQYRSNRAVLFELGGTAWRLDTFPRGLCLEVQAESAEVLARDERGLPVILKNRLGQGQVVVALPQVEGTIAKVSADPQQREGWGLFYKLMLEA
ncbi:MAG: hypothetical protein JW987_13365 [Anaerolineaceae bacterium]|nr:hypothetical protein [Anaerolineaceae bacterium]